MDTILGKPQKSVNHRTLKDQQGQVFRDEVSKGRIVAITNNNEIDGYLVPPAAYENACDALQELTRVKAALPLILAAARIGVAIPSETFDTLGIELPFDWQTLNEFQARFPVRITHTEDGAPMPAPRTGLQQQQFEEGDDEELIVVE